MAVTDSQVQPTAPDETLFTGRFVVPEGYPKAASGAFARFQFTRPAVWIPLALVVVATALLVVTASLGHYNVGAAPIIFPIVVIVLLASNMLVRSRALTKQIAVNAQPGGVYQVTMTDSLLTTVTPKASSSVRYDYYDAIDQQGEFLFLKVRGARIRALVPLQLFSDEALAFLRSKITR